MRKSSLLWWHISMAFGSIGEKRFRKSTVLQHGVEGA